jgi:hypothetical protein
MDNDEYNDAYYCSQFFITYPKFNPIQSNPETDTLRLTQEFSEKFFYYTQKCIEITPLSVIIDDIKNYRQLNDIQFTQLDVMTHEEKIKIIKIYNKMFSSLENIIN